MATLKEILCTGTARILGKLYCSEFVGNITGNADTTTKLATARTIQTNLASTSSVSFDGSADITPGVTGSLLVANGGTGATTAAAARTNLGVGASGTHADSYFALASHGTHVTYDSTNTPKANGTAAVGTATTVARSDHVHPLQTSVSGSSGSCTGNAATATEADGAYKLLNSTTINGTTFDGTNSITTAQWGKSRNVYIIDATAKNSGNATSVNGSSEIKLKLPEIIKASLDGNAATATKLETTRTIKTDLGSTSSASFDGSGNVSPGVIGTLQVTNGGTGATDAATARTNLGVGASGTHADSYFALASHGTHVSYGTSAAALGTSSAGSATTVSRSDHVHALPALTSCTGTLSVAKGGTGATTAAAARTNLGISNVVLIQESTPSDTTALWVW